MSNTHKLAIIEEKENKSLSVQYSQFVLNRHCQHYEIVQISK